MSSCGQDEQSKWKIEDNPLLTQWADDVDPENPWPEYPRPIMVRDNWASLNGLWDYAIAPKDEQPSQWEGQILVPYPLESALSGVKKGLVKMNACGTEQCLKYPLHGRIKEYC